MPPLSGFPSAEIHFDRDGTVVGTDAAAWELALLPEVTDLVVVAHGWNNDDQAARGLFGRLAGALRTAVDAGATPLPNGRALAILGVIWPSKQFDDTLTAPADGGAAGVGSGVGEDEVIAQIDRLRAVFDTEVDHRELDTAAGLVPKLEDSATARTQFADAVRRLVAGVSADPEDGPDDLLDKPGETVMQRLAVPVALAPPRGLADAGGHAAGLESLIGGFLGAARNLLNYTTFYEMKARAGTVGQRGLAPWLDAVHRERPDLRLHPVGHSFGARVVSAAAADLPERSLATLTLLQAAYSHFGLSEDWEPDVPGLQAGAFGAVLTRPAVRGPVLITHTANDTAVGIAYAIASRLAGQVAAAVGDAQDVFGGLGRNGAQRTRGTVATELLTVDGVYAWQPAVAHNLRADAFVRDHGDVTGPEVGHAILAAVAAS